MLSSQVVLYDADEMSGRAVTFPPETRAKGLLRAHGSRLNLILGRHGRGKRPC